MKLKDHKCVDYLTGDTYWLYESEKYSEQSTQCKCGNILKRHTTPVGTIPNWTNWTVA